MKKIVMVMMLFLGFQFFPANIHATVIDFESLNVSGTGPTYIGTTYSEDGYTLENTLGLYVTHPTNIDSIVMGTSGGGPVITNDNGNLFDLVSFDLMSPATIALVVTGIRQDGPPITREITFNLNDPVSHVTYEFEGFTDLQELSWNIGGYNTFDNIVLVPEPCSLLMLATGSLVLLRQRAN